MSSNEKIALVPSKPLAPLIGSVDTRRTPLPMRCAVRSRSSRFIIGPWFCPAAPAGNMPLSAAMFISVVCSTVPLPSGLSLTSVVLFRHAVSDTAATSTANSLNERIAVPPGRVNPSYCDIHERGAGQDGTRHRRFVRHRQGVRRASGAKGLRRRLDGAARRSTRGARGGAQTETWCGDTHDRRRSCGAQRLATDRVGSVVTRIEDRLQIGRAHV